MREAAAISYVPESVRTLPSDAFTAQYAADGTCSLLFLYITFIHYVTFIHYINGGRHVIYIYYIYIFCYIFTLCFSGFCPQLPLVFLGFPPNKASST